MGDLQRAGEGQKTVSSKNHNFFKSTLKEVLRRRSTFTGFSERKDMILNRTAGEGERERERERERRRERERAFFAVKIKLNTS